MLDILNSQRHKTFTTIKPTRTDEKFVISDIKYTWR